MLSLRHRIPVFVLVLISVPPVSAQQTTGTLQLRVIDSLNNPVEGVNVLVRGPNIQGARSQTTDRLGYVNVLALPPGMVRVSIDHVAYAQQVVEGVRIQLGRTTSLGDIRLRNRMHELPGVVISGASPLVDPGTTTYGGTLSSMSFSSLPVDRNYQSITSLLPLANTSYFGDPVNIGGASGYENKYFVDGVEVTDPLMGTSATALPYNFIQDVELRAGGYDAESRSSLGGVLNVVTFSGSNELHGSAFGFYTSNRFTGNKRVGLSDPAGGGFSNYDVGVGIGGPLIPDELWYFAAYNPTYTRRDVDVPGNGQFVDRTTVNSFAAKLTWRASEQLRFVMTATGDPTRQDAVGNGISFPPTGLVNTDPYFMSIGYGGLNISIDAMYSPSTNILIESSIARINRHDTGDPATERGNEPHFYDQTTDSIAGGVPSRWDSFRYSTSAKAAVSMTIGAHVLKAGVEYKVNGTDNRYFYDSIIRRDRAFYQEYVGRGYQTVHANMPSVFAQDEWQLGRSVRLNAGIRWDGQYIVGSDGAVDQTVTLPVQPRAGVTFLPGDDGSRKIFASFGRYSQEFALFQPMNLFSNQGYSYGINFVDDPRFSGQSADTVSGGPFMVAPPIDGLRGQYYDEFGLGYEQLFASHLRFRIHGLYRILREAIDDAYLPQDGAYHFGNPGRGLLSAWPRPKREFASLAVTLEQRFNEHFNFLLSYVLSRNYGNYSGIFDATAHNGFPNVGSTFDDRASTQQYGSGLLPNDRTHVFKFSGAFHCLSGLTLGMVLIAQTGTPLSEYVATDNFAQLIVPRGSDGRTPALWDLNMRVAYGFSFSGPRNARIIVDLFHIASQREPVDIEEFRGYLDPSGNLYPFMTYGKTLRYQPPMSARLGMEVVF